ncbi:MAG: hypothetical protein RL641_167 [Candidatus Parcubacteria bacterium]
MLSAIIIIVAYKKNTPAIVGNEAQKSPQNIWGAYTGNTDSTMFTFEKFVGNPTVVNAMFWGWNEAFPTTETGSQGKTLLLFWEPGFSYDRINDSSRDAYITTFADNARDYGYPVILAPFDEPNLNEEVWGNGIGTNTPQRFITAWKRVHDIFVAHQATNVKFALVYNNETLPSGRFVDFYPGDTYVDYVGIDGFNFGAGGPGGTKTFAQVFDSALVEAGAFSKPLWITSVGSAMPQSQFIYDLGARGLPWIWFNQSPFELDSASLPAFQQIIQ